VLAERGWARDVFYDISPSADSRPNEAAVPRAPEQVPVGEVLEHSFAEARINRPKATRLCHGELETWHLVVFGHDPIRKCAQL
jgi:hypothetical protein